ncbi:hypothetical protein PIB30_045649 [Stylosanthes scabra]|uniref:Serine/arginine repetitive matrix protein 1-like n=1 Tax=Stylosanthes scabra TaxID=79078 RepID=A0ABU6XGG1_9FABA|nr:hypothetical protein [Stylosanthes scabra]
MGCFLSKSQTQNQNPYHQKNQPPQRPLRPSLPNSNLNHQQVPLRPPPPPPVLEEESVKEVLSETPITKRNQVPILEPEPDTLLPPLQNPHDKIESKSNQHPIPNPIIINNKKEEHEVSEVVSQLSEEPCSISGSFSTATTITEKREDEVTSKRSIIRDGSTTMAKNHKWNNNRSPSRKRPHAGDGNVASGRERRLKSPARRSEPSPEKRLHGGLRPVRGRESGSMANRKLNVGSAGFRRDAGEGSGRRSRSPSCARSGSAGGKAGASSGGRKEVPATKGAVEKEEKKGSEGGENKNEEIGQKNDVVSQEESIENPLVSMECFIFL